MTHNLMDFVTSIRGPCAAQRYPDRVELIHADDDVIFRGPSSLNVSVEVETHLTPLHEAISNGPRTVAASLYSYDINIPAGFTSRFEMRAWRDTGRLAHGRKLVIRWHPCPPVPCVPPDIPCDFAVRHEPDCGYVFPAGCEPCGNLPVRMPPDCGPTLTVVPARGGCIRPRFLQWHVYYARRHGDRASLLPGQEPHSANRGTDMPSHEGDQDVLGTELAAGAEAAAHIVSIKCTAARFAEGEINAASAAAKCELPHTSRPRP
jgi:hypothetical protein